MSPAEVLAKIAAAMVRGAVATGSVTPEIEVGDQIVLVGTPKTLIAPSPSAERRTKDRHKPNQAEYMRAYRARKKAEKAGVSQ